MKKTFGLLIVTVTLILSGCSGKKVFEPEDTDYDASYSSCATPIHATSKGATLNDGTYISFKSQGKVPEGFHFVDDNSAPVFVNNEGLVKVKNKTINLGDRVVVATLIDEQLAFITHNNRFGLYDLTMDKIIFQEIAQPVETIHTRVVPPVKIDDLIIFPTLNGKLVVVSDNQIIREITVTPKGNFNNIIFLNVLGNTLVAATSSDIIALGGRVMERQKFQIADIVLTDEEMYLFTKDGSVIRLDERLNTIQETNFQFANFIWASLVDGHVYGVEKAGHIIAFDKDLDYRIYELDDDITDLSFFKNGILYYGGSCQSI